MVRRFGRRQADMKGAEKPGMEKPGMEKPGMKKPGMKKSGMMEPGMKQPGIKHSNIGRSMIRLGGSGIRRSLFINHSCVCGSLVPGGRIMEIPERRRFLCQGMDAEYGWKMVLF